MKTILVVDDMAVFREPIAASLNHQGYETLGAANGREAMQMVHQNRPDLILLDVAMPVMNGLDFLRNLRQDPKFKDLPVILLTAVSERDYIVQAGKLGVRDYLLKSRFSLKELSARVESYFQTGDASDASTRRGDFNPHASKPADDSGDEPAAPAPQQPMVDPNATALEALKSIKPITNRSQINEHIENFTELKALSPTVGQLMKQTQSANCSIEQVAKTIKQDQAIALKVLKLANSVVYSRGEPVESVQKAVMRIGLSQIREAVMNIAVMDNFSSDNTAAHIDSKLFWEHSIGTGMIAAQLARLRGEKEGEVEAAFTMGLLHDVGRMVLADHLQELYGQVLETAAKLHLPLEQVESRMILVNHADLMDKLLHAWKFSKNLINPIAFHHLSMSNARKLAPRSITECATLGLANRLAHAMQLGSSGNEALYPTEDFAHALKLRPDDVADIVKHIPEQTDDIKFAMLSATDNKPWPDVRKQTRERLGAPLRPIFVSSEPAFDAYRIFTETLAEPRYGAADAEEKPNIAVVHIRNVNERVQTTTRLRAAETEAGVKNLPTLLISPKANLLLEDSAMPDRPHELLPSPTSTARLLRAMRKLLGVKDPEAAANSESQAA